MRIVALIILIFGVALAGGAVYFASDKFEQLEAALLQRAQEAVPQSSEPAIKTVPIIVATKSLDYGAVLTEDVVRIVQFPEDSAPNNAFGTFEDLFGAGGPSNERVVLRAMEPNEPVLNSKVTGFGERATISAQLTPGMRAFTLRIDTVSGVAGFLLPNDRVDIFLTRTGREGLTSNLIMQNVKVIAVDQFADKDNTFARVARTATVEVLPQDAQKLSLAQSVGKISLSLRQIDEVETSDGTPVIKLDDIITQEKPAEPLAPPPVQELCVRKGTEVICEQTN